MWIAAIRHICGAPGSAPHGSPSPATGTGNETGLRAYSATCLRRTWVYQDFSDRNTLMLHDAGNPARSGTFRRGIARAQLARLLTSRAELRSYAELTAGLG